MAEELRSLDVSENVELLHLAQDVAETGIGRVLRTSQGDLAKVLPASNKKDRSTRRSSFTREDPLYKLIGTGDSGAPSDASERKHDVLARAYDPKA
jgi:hypothetical protein